MRPTVYLPALSLLSLLSAGCSAAPSAADTPASRDNQGIVAGTLEVSVARPSITLRNTTEFVVGYLVTDKDMATVALFPPCGAQCPKLEQGRSVTIRYQDIAGYTARSTEAIVMWWTYTRNADGSYTATGAVNSRKVTL